MDARTHSLIATLSRVDHPRKPKVKTQMLQRISKSSSHAASLNSITALLKVSHMIKKLSSQTKEPLRKLKRT
tara:strand:+ start:388 stop:603 length:216 start_codon:yes stop_codon:yes gene_type:complete